MVTIIICGIIGIITSVILFLSYKGCENIRDLFLLCLFMIGNSFVFGCFGFIIGMFLPEKTEIVKTTYILKSLQDNNSVKGSFFIGTGIIQGSMVYAFYYKENGSYRLMQIDTDKASISYSYEKPKVEMFSRKRVKDAFINYFVPTGRGYYRETKYVIYVPKGTIKQDYLLDAK